MKTLLTLLVFFSSAAVSLLSGAETAHVRMYCFSLRFGTGSSVDGLYSMELGTVSSGANGELAPTFASPSHISNFVLNDPVELEPLTGTIAFDVPSADANQNGFDDFFEVSQPISGTTTGRFATPVGNGTVRATWNRAAGSSKGTCVLRLTSDQFGQLPDMTHAFDLLEYTGTLSYTAGTNNVTGSVSLVQTGDPSNQMGGPVEFIKSPANHLSQLEIQPGVWTNAALQSLWFTNNVVQRDETVRTNYYSYMDFQDGDPATPESDYLSWVLSIDDTNDANGDGIPDFSDDPLPTAPRPPVLALSRSNTNLVLSIAGTPGRVHEVQETLSLSTANWTTILSLTLTNDLQTVFLPVPTGDTRFWRVRSQ